MFWIKRFFCGLIAIALIVSGAMLLNSSSTSRIIVSGLLLVGGATLAYVAIKQTLPSYNFWMTIIAISLAYALFSSKIHQGSNIDVVNEEESVKNESESMPKPVQVKQSKK